MRTNKNTVIAMVCVATAAGAGVALSGAVAGGVPERTTDVVLTPFSPANPEATAEMLGVPLPSAGDPIREGAGLELVGGDVRPSIANEAAGQPLDPDVRVNKAVQRSREESSREYRQARSLRINLQGDYSFAGEDYRVEVLQPSEEAIATGIEAPGNPGRVGRLDVFNTETAPGVSLATTVVAGGDIITVTGGSRPAVRVALLRKLGLI